VLLSRLPAARLAAISHWLRALPERLMWIRVREVYGCSWLTGLHHVDRTVGWEAAWRGCPVRWLRRIRWSRMCGEWCSVRTVRTEHPTQTPSMLCKARWMTPPLGGSAFIARARANG
jgi:hypothetical protein